MGTVEYMAPEILRGEDSGPLGDVYALGTLLWEILVGSTPYRGRTPAMTMNAILSDPVPNLAARVDNLPEGMAAVVSRALAKRPEDRQGSAKHLLGELRAVIEALRHPGPRETQALSAVTGDVPHNLPAAITRFVGRERERQELTHLLSEHRLVTISGPGGAGKTRLAQELGRDRLQDFPGGVYFVDLAVRDTPAQVPSSIAAVFDLREEPGRAIEETLIESLRHRTVLLILDNCEHLVDTCAALAARLLQECPQLRLVATSQERLGVPGEWMWEIPPLSLPAADATMSEILASSSVQLFVDRATSVKSSFVLTEQTAPTVVQICRRLDAIPLAIELAAARVRILTVEQILERLEDRFRLLTGGAHTLLPRQQTLHNTVSWSVELLSEEERLVYERISVFRRWLLSRGG